MAIIRHKEVRRPQIDLSGPQGNVFCLIGQGLRWGKQLGWDKKQLAEFKKGMMAGDYDDAIQFFDSKFGSMCDLIMPEEQVEEHTNTMHERSVEAIAETLMPDHTPANVEWSSLH